MIQATHTETSPTDAPPAAPPKVSPIPTDAECLELWDAFHMLENIRTHSLMVALVATELTLRAEEAGMEVNVHEVRASALLHDLAKTYTISHGGNHSQLGGAWVQELTGNPAIAQGVVHHVHWPFDLDLAAHFLPLVIIYSDKRVKHNRLVALDERFVDLEERYGSTEYIRQRIRQSFEQARAIERALSQTLGLDINEHSFDRRGLVERT